MQVVRMPKVGEMMEEGTVIEWLVEPGQSVAAEAPLVIVDTDKVDYEVESPYTGAIARLVAQVGETVPVGAPLCEIAVPD